MVSLKICSASNCWVFRIFVGAIYDYIDESNLGFQAIRAVIWPVGRLCNHLSVGKSMNITSNFTSEEMACPCCKRCDMNPEFMNKLQKFRDLLGFPVQIDSGFRCERHNQDIGGVKNSQHLVGKAADISYRHLPADQRCLLISQALVNFDGIGLGKTFIHIDCRGNKALWFY